MQDYLRLFQPLLMHAKTVQFVYSLTEGQVHYVSEAYEPVFERPAARVNDDLPDWLAQLHPDDWPLVRQRLLALGPEEVLQDVELRRQRPDGSLQWLCLSACRAQGPDGQAYLSGSLLDFSTSKKAAQNAQKFNTKKDATLEILSHDLAAPLVLLQQLTEHLQQELQEQGSSTHELLLHMQRTCRQGVTLIRDFVDNEFLESVNVELNWERSDLGAWLNIVMSEYQRSEWHTHLRFPFSAPPEPVYVNLDVNKFQQVVNNLIGNAIKFTPDGGQIEVGLAQRGNRALVTITDTGVGIPEHLQAGLFEKFTKARRPGLRGEKTTGLGMSIIQTIVALHHGQIYLESVEGQGSTFIIELPVAE